MSRGGRDKDRSDPERRCIATGVSGPTAPLVRFVVGPEGDVFPDVAEKAPGRGMWVCAERAAIDLAVKKNLFSRSAKAPVKASPDLSDRVEELLTRRLQDALALARGFTMIERRHDAECQVQTGTGIADLGTGHQGRPVEETGR